MKFAQNAHRAVVKNRDEARVIKTQPSIKVSTAVMKSILSDYHFTNPIIKKTVYVTPTIKESIKPIAFNSTFHASLIPFICEPDGDSYTSETNGLIITMTSWQKRINNVERTVSSILNNTVLPERIIINLSTEEFPRKEEDLPNTLLNLIRENPIVEIHWLKHNTTVWKKIIPTMLRFKNANIVCVDDDRLYPKDFVETFKKAAEGHPNGPVTGANISFYKNFKQHCGHATLDRYEFYEKGLDFITQEVMDLKSSDAVLTIIANMTGNGTVFLGKNYLSIIKQDNNPIEGYSTKNKISVSIVIRKCYDLFNAYLAQKKNSQSLPQEVIVGDKPDDYNEKIIVSFTSWKKRISYCKHIFDIMLAQTMKPNKIILNLSTDEFTNKELDLPDDLVNLVEKNDICEINWVKENTTVWKKFMPVLDEYQDDVIIPIDDDIEYPNNYVEALFHEYLKWDRQCPVTCFANIRSYGSVQNVYAHSGPFSLIKKKFFGPYLDEIYNNVIKDSITTRKWASDEVYTYCAWLNGIRYKFTDSINGKKLYDSSQLNKKDGYSQNYGIEFKKRLELNKEYIENYIHKTYGKKLEALFDAPIYVNITTYPKRDKYLPKMLASLREQTILPDKVILWLAADEYDKNNVPQHIIKCVNDGLLSEIRWVSKNIYCHKRHEIFKTGNNVYNLFMDDDIYYPKTYIEELYRAAKKYQNSVISYCGVERAFINGKLTPQTPNMKEPSRKNMFLGGLTCFPPYTFPTKSFKYVNIRDKYATKCDESWVSCWLLKNKTSVYVLHNWLTDRTKVIKTIDDANKVSLWNETKVLEDGKHMKKELMVYRILKELGLIGELKSVFTNADSWIMDIEKRNNF